MTPRSITIQWVKDNYDIEKEKKILTKKLSLDFELNPDVTDPSKEKDISFEDWFEAKLAQCEKRKNKLPDGAHNVSLKVGWIEFESWSDYPRIEHDYRVFLQYDILETDDECIRRIQTAKKDELRKIQEKEDAKKSRDLKKETELRQLTKLAKKYKIDIPEINT